MSIEEWLEQHTPERLSIWREASRADETLEMAGMIADGVGFIEVNGRLFVAEENMDAR